MTISKLPSNASLRQVMDKFEEIMLSDFGGTNIDVRVATSLPSTVKNGQMLLIHSNTSAKVHVAGYSKIVSNGEILVRYDLNSNKRWYVQDNRTNIEMCLISASVNVNNTMKSLDGYIGINGSWVQFSWVSIVLYDKGVCSNGMNVPANWAWGKTSNFYCDVVANSDSLEFTGTANGPENTNSVTFKTPQDLTNFTRLVIEGNKTSQYGKIKVGVSNSTAYGNLVAYSTLGSGTHTVNIENIRGSKYITVDFETTGIGQYAQAVGHIFKIELQ